MAFKGFTDNSPARKENRFDKKCAERLHKALIISGRLQRGSKPSKWPSEFRMLRKDHSEETITRVLDWYVKNIGKQLVSEAYSARSFRLKFQNIVTQAKIQEKKNPTVVVCDQAKQSAKYLTSLLAFPEEAEETIPAVVQLSFENLCRIKNALALINKPKGMGGFIVGVHLSQAFGFIEQWLKESFMKKFGWKDWDGNMVREAVSVDNKKFVTFLEWAGNSYAGKAGVRAIREMVRSLRKDG